MKMDNNLRSAIVFLSFWNYMVYGYLHIFNVKLYLFVTGTNLAMNILFFVLDQFEIAKGIYLFKIVVG